MRLRVGEDGAPFGAIWSAQVRALLLEWRRPVGQRGGVLAAPAPQALLSRFLAGKRKKMKGVSGARGVGA